MFYNFGEGAYSSKLKAEQHKQGVALFKQRRYAEAVELFLRAATDGYLPSECYLGYCYARGLGVERSPREALRWYSWRLSPLYSWVVEDIKRLRSEVGDAPAKTRESVTFVDSQFGEIVVYFSANIEYPQVRFNANNISVTLFHSEPYGRAVGAICHALVNADFRRQGWDYGRIDENFTIDFPLFKLRIERGAGRRYSHRCEGLCYTIVVPATTDFNRVNTREYIIDYATKLLKKAAESYLPQRIAELSAQTGLIYSRCKIVTKRWGCYFLKSKVVYLSYYLMKCSAEFVDSVIVHELVHSLCKYHNNYFYATLRKYGGERLLEVDRKRIGENAREEIM
ncbi:MAG: DUF45 domain-containing protein [Alistipes sp.]|nr:DUF45 domain-containing protein [Alistipes sp.]